MEIVAFDTDDRADGQGKAKITWISKDLLPTAKSYNSSATTTGGWESSYLREYLKNTIKPLIPEAVRNAIVPVTKVQSIYSGSLVKNGQTTTDDVWIPGHHEVFNNTDSETTGAVYRNKFTDSTSRIKYKRGAKADWWTRSVKTASEVRIATNGTPSQHNASYGASIALGFCT